MPFINIIYNYICIYVYIYIQGYNTHVANGNDCTVEYSCGRKSSGTEGSIKQLSHSLGIFNHPCQLGHSLKKLTASAVDIPCNIYDQFWSMARLSMIYPALGLLTQLTLNNDYPFLDDLPDFTHEKLRFDLIFHRGSCHRSLFSDVGAVSPAGGSSLCRFLGEGFNSFQEI